MTRSGIGRLRAALAGLWLAGVLAAGAAPATLAEAQRLAREQRLAEAVKLVEQLRREQPQNDELLLRHAQFLSWQARLQSAAKVYQELLDRRPADRDARTGLGLTQFWRGDWSGAETAFAAVLAVDPNHEIARDAWLRLRVAQSRASEAFQQAMDRDRASGQSDPELGLILAGLYAAAGDELTADALAQRPSPDPDLGRRQVRFRAQRQLVQRQTDAAVRLVEAWAKAHPGDYESQVDAGDVLAAADRAAAAQARYEDAGRQAPERPEAWLGLARLASRQSRWADSEAWCRRVVTENPEAIEGWLGLARARQHQGDTAGAWTALTEALTIAPGSTLVFEAQLQLARQTGDRARTADVLAAYRAAQPGDRRLVLWEQEERRRRGEPVSAESVQALLDPLAPELTVPALHWLARTTAGGRPAAWAALPAAPDPALEASARRTLAAGLRQLDPDVFGVRVGYEYAWVEGQGGTALPDWQEAFVALSWRQPGRQSFWLEWHHYERFGTDAAQWLGGWERELGTDWRLRAQGGGDQYGGFLADWRAGLGVSYSCSPRLTAHLDAQHLAFLDLQVWQLTPGLTWQMSPRWEAGVRVYAGRSDLRLGQAIDTLSFSASLTWQAGERSAWRLGYAYGDEDSSNPVRNLVAEQNFQAVALEWRWTPAERWLLIPAYRYERHQQFDFHSLGLAVQRQF